MTASRSSSKPLGELSSSVPEEKIEAGRERVAEGIATYNAFKPRQAERKITAPAKQILEIPVSDEAWDFAVANALLPNLETAVRLVHDCFSAVAEIQLLHEADWEMENNSWITIAINVSGTTGQLLEQYHRFTAEMIKQVPPDKSDKILLSF